jgi:hypothetical protein
MAFAQYCDKILKTDFATQPEMLTQNDVQTPIQNKGNALSAPTAMLSID